MDFPTELRMKNANLIDLTWPGDRKDTVRLKENSLRTGARATRRDAPRKPTAGRDGSETVVSMEAWVGDLVLRLGFSVELRWRKSGKK